MNYLQLYFRDRIKWLSLPLDDDEFRRALKHFSEEGEQLHFLEYRTQHGLSAWLNPGRLQAVRFILDVLHQPKFDVSECITPQDFSDLEDIDFYDLHWDVYIWLAGRVEPFCIDGVTGHGWVAITDCLENRRPFLFVTDGDGEEVAVKTADINLLTGLEVSRYNDDKKLEVAENEVSSEE